MDAIWMPCNQSKGLSCMAWQSRRHVGECLRERARILQSPCLRETFRGPRGRGGTAAGRLSGACATSVKDSRPHFQHHVSESNIPLESYKSSAPGERLCRDVASACTQCLITASIGASKTSGQRLEYVGCCYTASSPSLPWNPQLQSHTKRFNPWWCPS